MLFVITQHTDQMFLRDDQALSRWANVFAKMDADQIRETLRRVEKDDQIASLAFVPSGEDQGITNSGAPFDPAQFEFANGRHVSGADMSEPYMGSVGAWCYCLRTEIRGGEGPLGTLYGEFIYDNFRSMIPQEFYSNNGVIYLMDADSGRFVVHPNNLAGTKGGNRNLKFFLEHNQVTDASMLEQIGEGIAHGDRMMIRLTLVGRPSYMYFWPTGEGRHYLVGYVPEDSITSLSDSVTMTIVFMMALLAALFLILTGAYVIYHRYRRKIEAERAQEQEEHMRQVSQALELAQSANRFKSIFLSNMSHDIRTPMNAIIGFSTLLMRDADNPQKVREYTRKVSASSQHLLSLINDVLDMSKIESGKMVLNVSQFDLADVVTAVDTVIRPQAAAKKQTLEVSVSGLRYETLLGDETRINQILINLLSNAVKYTQEGGHIDFIIQGFQAPGQFQGLQIVVRDNGYGMTPEYCERIFDAFSRAENSTTNKVQGTGLGMAITKSTVELMGGTIHVDSTYGEGSTFTVRLELRIPEGAADASFWEAAAPDLLEGCHFLAAEDNELNAEILRELLEMQGASCDIVENGKLAAGALAAAMALGAAGCGGGNEIKREEAAAARTVQLFGPNTRAALSKAVEDMSPAERMYAMSEQNSGVVIDFNTYQAEDYQDKTYDQVCLDRVRSHMGDDLMLMNADVISALGKEGLLPDLSGMEAASRLRDCVLTANTINGELVAIPQEIVAYGLFCNVELFEKYGLALPETPEDLLHCCEVFQENGIQYPIGANRWRLELFVLSQGFAEMYINGDPSSEIEALNKGEARLRDYMRPGLEYLQLLFDRGYIDYKTAYTYEAMDEAPKFLAQETPIVMSYQGAAAPERNYGSLDFRMEVIGIPSALGQVPVLSISGSCIPKDAPQKENALALFEQMLSEEILVDYVNSNGSISPFKGELEGLKVQENSARLSESVNSDYYVLATNGNLNIELWGNTCVIVQHLMAGATVEECLAEFDALQDAAVRQS